MRIISHCRIRKGCDFSSTGNGYRSYWNKEEPSHNKRISFSGGREWNKKVQRKNGDYYQYAPPRLTTKHSTILHVTKAATVKHTSFEHALYNFSPFCVPFTVRTRFTPSVLYGKVRIYSAVARQSGRKNKLSARKKLDHLQEMCARTFREGECNSEH